MRIGTRVLGTLVVALLVVACSDDGDGGDSDSAPSSTTIEDVAATTSVAPTTTIRPRPDGPVPAVTGPVTGGLYGVPYNPAPADVLAAAGYVEEEYFVDGTATSYLPAGAFGTDGVWAATASATAPYRTRVLVRRPADPDAFNGTVVVEWLNVSSGRDSDPDFAFLYPYLLREGYAFVGVSAQRTGVEGGGGVLEIPGVPPESLTPLKIWDPQRYGSLAHPGDEFSYDIYSQVGRWALGADGTPGALADLAVERVLAVGESQSAGRLVTYVNAVHPQVLVYDGFLIHSRGGAGAVLNPAAADARPSTAAIRTDLEQPVLQFQTETDLFRLGFVAARQDDTDRIMTWEVAGTAHADASTLAYGRASAEVWFDGAGPDFSVLCGRVNEGPQAQVLRAAFDALHRWVVDGTTPPVSPRLETTTDAFVVDELGIALGGIRTPAVDVPTNVLSGVPREGSSVFCSLFGRTDPLPEGTLAARYPTAADYAAAVEASADAAADAGFLLAAERDEIVADASRGPRP